MIRSFVRDTYITYILCVFALALFGFPLASFAQTAPGVGFRPVSIDDPVNGGTFPGYVFYPSTEPSQTTWLGPYELKAAPDAAVTKGSKPLVVISHGHGGSALGHHDLAAYLARHGFIAASLEHPKDNFHDTSGTGTAAVLVGRPIQIKAMITALLNDSSWEIDASRIGVAGFSAGGYTALMVAGAVPRFERFIDYCKQQPQDAEICAPLEKVKPKGKAKAELAALQADLHKWGSPADPRVKAAFVMAPLSVLFDKTGLAQMRTPIFLYYGQDDRVLLPKYNVLHIAPLIKTPAGIKSIPKAGHYVFLSPCSPKLMDAAPAICNDPPASIGQPCIAY
ncbi:MAG: hypothetical protein IT174_17585 [Acidobacteria bacterium]|nr:hypothetical protein [Acidobacteriota bacterium]